MVHDEEKQNKDQNEILGNDKVSINFSVHSDDSKYTNIYFILCSVNMATVLTEIWSQNL